MKQPDKHLAEAERILARMDPGGLITDADVIAYAHARIDLARAWIAHASAQAPERTQR